jgi:hypothetical protein
MSSEDGTWYELQTERQPTGRAERYRDKAAAEQAATALLIRHADLQFVDVAAYEIHGGTTSPRFVVSRITGSRPPKPEEAAVDGLHLLPRGDPEC